MVVHLSSKLSLRANGLFFFCMFQLDLVQSDLVRFDLSLSALFVTEHDLFQAAARHTRF